MFYWLLYLNSRIGFNGLKYLYSVISVIEKRLPGNTKKWTLVSAISSFLGGLDTEEGVVTEGKRKKTKIILGTQPKARAGFPKRLRLIQATPSADFAVLDVQLCSTITAILPWVDNFAFNYYSRPRF